MVSRRVNNIPQGRDIGSSHKGKTPRIISLCSSSDDGDDGYVVDDGENEDTNGDNGAGGDIGASNVVYDGYINQVEPDMSWAQGVGK